MSAQKVLIAIDDSENAKEALDYYVDFLHKAGNQVVICQCIEYPYSPYPLREELAKKLLDESKDQANKVQMMYAEALRQKGIDNTIVQSEFSKDAGNFIVESATKENVGMIVMGSRGLGKVRRTILGSVSDYVVHHAHCAVVVCKQ